MLDRIGGRKSQMWEYEHSIETAARPEAIFALYADVATWPRWDDGIADLRLYGPFAVGTPGVLTPKGQDPLPFRLSAVWPDRGFADETEIPGAGLLLRFVHTLTPLGDGRTRITHRVEIDGPAAGTLGPEIGPGITGGFPTTMATLARQAGEG